MNDQESRELFESQYLRQNPIVKDRDVPTVQKPASPLSLVAALAFWLSTLALPFVVLGDCLTGGVLAARRPTTSPSTSYTYAVMLPPTQFDKTMVLQVRGESTVPLNWRCKSYWVDWRGKTHLWHQANYDGDFSAAIQEVIIPCGGVPEFFVTIAAFDPVSGKLVNTNNAYATY